MSRLFFLALFNALSDKSLRDFYGIRWLVEVISGCQWDARVGFCLVVGLFSCSELPIVGPSAGTNSFVAY